MMLNNLSKTDMLKLHSYQKYSCRLLFLLPAILLLWSCDRTREDKGLEYFPDMAHSLAYETYTTNPVLADGRTMMKPVEGTIPRNMIPLADIEIDRSVDRPGAEIISPIIVDQKVLDEGKELYGIFCINCHGEKGDGKGNLYTSGLYTVPPRSLIDSTVISQTSGQIFYSISAGYGVMGQHASLIRTDDRWKIVAYIEKMIQKR
jgi:mono/diheme cytochrome c family protein